jgi:hypothetical protein
VNGERWQTWVFWATFAVTASIAATLLLRDGTDAMGKALAKFYAMAMLAALGGGLLAFTAFSSPKGRLLAALLAGAPIIAVPFLSLAKRLDESAGDYRQSARYYFEDAAARAVGQAVERGDLDAIRNMVASGANPNAKGREGQTLLYFALRKSKLPAARLLLSLGADPNTPCPSGVPVIYEALSPAWRELVEPLLEKGAKVDFRDDNGRTLMVRALDNGALHEARLLAERGAPLDVPVGRTTLRERLSGPPLGEPGSAERADYEALRKALSAR